MTKEKTLSRQPMTPRERRSVAVLAGLYALRIMGLFMILPVFALYAEDLSGSTPFKIGLAIGVYGLSQALLQIPFGAWSDRLGRKPVIVAGLVIFALGSVLAAVAESIEMVIAARALQGAGAIASVLIALLSDLTREEQRTKAMAVIGMTIGVAFAGAFVLGPILANGIGVRGIFWLMGGLAVAAIALLLGQVPTPVRGRRRASRPLAARFLPLLTDHRLWRLDVSIFFLHLLLTAQFVVLPLLLVREVGLPAPGHWQLYLPVMFVAFLTMAPFILFSHRRGRVRAVFAGAVAVLGLAEMTYSFGHGTLTGLIVALWLFFTAFNLLEAMLPSLISRLAPPADKGAAIGVYSTAQFLGAFVGGGLGGWLLGAYGAAAVFLFCGGLTLVWLVVILTMAEPHFLESRELVVGACTTAEADRLARRLERLRGVSEVVVVAEEGVAYLRVDGTHLDEEALRRFSVSG